jgi:hypothetical protein
MMPMGGHDGLIDNLALVRGRQAMLPRKFPKLFVGEASSSPVAGWIIIERE